MPNKDQIKVWAKEVYLEMEEEKKVAANPTPKKESKK